MPRKDGTGPPSSGGGKFARRSGTGAGPGRGRMGGPAGGGPGGFCKCPNCGTRSQHQAGQPCYEVKCPQCGTAMVRG